MDYLSYDTTWIPPIQKQYINQLQFTDRRSNMKETVFSFFPQTTDYNRG